MKSLLFVFTLSLSTTALADNLICAIFDSNHEQIARAKFDTDKNEPYQTQYFGDEKRLSLSLNKTSPGFISVSSTMVITNDGVNYYPNSSVTLDESMIQSMTKGKSFGFALKGGIERRDFATCYNMKNEEKAPFDPDYKESKDSPIGENRDPSEPSLNSAAARSTGVKLPPMTDFMLNGSKPIPHPDSVRK